MWYLFENPAKGVAGFKAFVGINCFKKRLQINRSFIVMAPRFLRLNREL